MLKKNQKGDFRNFWRVMALFPLLAPSLGCRAHLGKTADAKVFFRDEGRIHSIILFVYLIILILKVF